LSITHTNQAAWSLAKDSTGVPLPRIPDYPVFIAMDGGVLSTPEAVPIGMQPLAAVLSSADFVVLGITARAGGRLELGLDADCMSPATANTIRNRVQSISDQAGSFLSALHDGTVKTEGNSVHGRWPLDRDALQALVSP
jgi:hypothetical protein